MARAPRRPGDDRAKDIADRYIRKDGKGPPAEPVDLDAIGRVPKGEADEDGLRPRLVAPPAPVKKPPKLTAKQVKFIAEYLVDLNASQAAIRAGYSERTAGQAGYENLKKPEIAAAIETGKREQLERAGMDADDLLKRLTTEVLADLADLYDAHGALKPVHEWPMIWRQGLVAGIEVEELFAGSGEDRRKIGQLTKLKMADRAKRMEMFGKHVKISAFRENHLHDVPKNSPLRLLAAQLIGTSLRPKEPTSDA